jgi:hypothetical protein
VEEQEQERDLDAFGGEPGRHSGSHHVPGGRGL